MYGKMTGVRKKSGFSMMAAALVFGAGMAVAQEAVPDKVLADWLGTEFTVQSSSVGDRMPLGGKLTFVFDANKNVVHLCTRNADEQNEPWKMDFAKPCGVTMTFTAGTRYCSADDIKTGDAEMLASCHRLRTHDVAMRPSEEKGAVELNDMVAFLVKGKDGKQSMTILVDSPARLTEDGSVVVGR